MNSFELLVRNDLLGLQFDCPTIEGICSCPFPSTLTPQVCALAGSDIVNVRTTNRILRLEEQELTDKFRIWDMVESLMGCISEFCSSWSPSSDSLLGVFWSGERSDGKKGASYIFFAFIPIFDFTTGLSWTF